MSDEIKISEIVPSPSGVGRVEKVLKRTSTTEVKGIFWQITHNSGEKEVSLKLGRYKKDTWIPWSKATNEITLSEDEINLVIDFITNNYRPIKAGESKWLPITNKEIKKFLNENPDSIDLSFLKLLDFRKLRDINSLVSVARLDKILNDWNDNKNNNSEEYWQKLFQENTWILSQIFSCPFIFVGKKFYCGGKEDDDKGGVKGDLLYKNNLTKNLAFIEIKTPETEIMGSKYRGDEEGKDNVIYSMSNHLSGGVNQILNQRKVYQNNHGDNDGKFLHNAKCVLIIGKIDNLKDEDEKKSFELYRSASKEVEVITFDELFGRVQAIRDLLKE